jgi:hypothetical protein
MSDDMRKEMHKRRRIRKIEKRSCYEEVESLQDRYRARRLPPIQPRKKYTAVVAPEEEAEIVPQVVGPVQKRGLPPNGRFPQLTLISTTHPS